MKTVNEVSKAAGVSVRTLHHYDAIGLLKPSKITEAGYRLYDDTALEKLQSILLFRELQFPLKEIKAILESPTFDQKKALNQQVTLLELQRRHLDELIAFAREIITTGVKNMDFSVFDKSELEAYAAEAKKAWGETAAYQEYEQKAQKQTDAEKAHFAEELMKLFAEIGKSKELSPSSDEAQNAVRQLRQFITEHYYTCTPQILRGLGQMYVCDERMKANIDTAGGSGTAEFTAKAIELYCKTAENENVN